MSAFVFTTLVLGILVHEELRPKWQEKHWKSLVIGGLFLLAGYGILTLTAFDISIGSPLAPVHWLVAQMGRLL